MLLCVHDATGSHEERGNAEEELNKRPVWFAAVKFGADFHSSAELPGAAIFLFMFKCESVRWAVRFLLNHPTLPSERATLLLKQLPRRRKQGTNATFLPTSLSSCPWKENYNSGFDATLTCFKIFSISADILDYHSNEPAPTSFSRLNTETVLALCRGTWKQWLIAPNGKRRKMMTSLLSIGL